MKQFFKYNEREEEDVLVSDVLEDFSDEIIKLFEELKIEIHSFEEMGIDLEEKAFYDILKTLMKKYDFSYPDDKLLDLAKAVKLSLMIKPNTPTGAKGMM